MRPSLSARPSSACMHSADEDEGVEKRDHHPVSLEHSVPHPSETSPNCLLPTTDRMRSLLLTVLAGSQAVCGSVLKSRASASAYVSSSDGKYKLSGWDAPVSGAGTPGTASTWKLTVDDTSSGHKQVVTGFGAAVTDATVTVINELPANLRSQLLSELMTGAGADFSLLRHTIASSDLSADPAYTYDDASGNADASLSNFYLGDRGNAMAEMLAEMQALNSNSKLLGSVWAPPAWMQLDNALSGTTVNVSSSPDHLHDYSLTWCRTT